MDPFAGFEDGTIHHSNDKKNYTADHALSFYTFTVFSLTGLYLSAVTWGRTDDVREKLPHLTCFTSSTQGALVFKEHVIHLQKHFILALLGYGYSFFEALSNPFTPGSLDFFRV